MVAWSALVSLFGEDDAVLFATRQAEREAVVAGAAKRRRLVCRAMAEAHAQAQPPPKPPKRRCGPQGKKHKHTRRRSPGPST